MTRKHRLDVHPTFLLGKNATVAIWAAQRPLVKLDGAHGRPLPASRKQVPQATLR
jgi:hypothetical protein